MSAYMSSQAIISYLVLVGDIKRIELKLVAGQHHDNAIQSRYYDMKVIPLPDMTVCY